VAPRPRHAGWSSFVAAGPRGLHEEGNPAHRARVEYNRETLHLHDSDEDGSGWTVLAIDRASRRTAVAQGRRQVDAARAAHEALYG
jgi:hypothetical protein